MRPIAKYRTLRHIAALACLVLLASLLALLLSRCWDGDEPAPIADRDLLLASDVAQVSGFDDVVLVDLTANPNAPYQAAFEREDGERLAILTVQDEAKYAGIIENVDGDAVDIGDEAVVCGGAVYFRKGDRAITLYTVSHLDEGELRPTLTSAQVVDLARIVAGRL